ncbi:hypothetical protein ACOMHN_057043 [Nucella lapillus]
MTWPNPLQCRSAVTVQCCEHLSSRMTSAVRVHTGDENFELLDGIRQYALDGRKSDRGRRRRRRSSNRLPTNPATRGTLLTNASTRNVLEGSLLTNASTRNVWDGSLLTNASTRNVWDGSFLTNASTRNVWEGSLLTNASTRNVWDGILLTNASTRNVWEGTPLTNTTQNLWDGAVPKNTTTQNIWDGALPKNIATHNLSESTRPKWNLGVIQDNRTSRASPERGILGGLQGRASRASPERGILGGLQGGASQQLETLEETPAGEMRIGVTSINLTDGTRMTTSPPERSPKTSTAKIPAIHVNGVVSEDRVLKKNFGSMDVEKAHEKVLYLANSSRILQNFNVNDLLKELFSTKIQTQPVTSQNTERGTSIQDVKNLNSGEKQEKTEKTSQEDTFHQSLVNKLAQKTDTDSVPIFKTSTHNQMGEKQQHHHEEPEETPSANTRNKVKAAKRKVIRFNGRKGFMSLLFEKGKNGDKTGKTTLPDAKN